jgi:uncharacterized membrane protein YfhO
MHEPGEVVLLQQAARGWSVSIDGRPATPRVVDGLFRGVEVGAGRHRIIWEYRPPALAEGAAITAAAILFVVFSLLVKRSGAIRAKKNFSSITSEIE